MFRKNKSPIEDCTSMLHEIDSLLKRTNSKPSKVLSTSTYREISREFSNAVKALSNRVLSSRGSNFSYISNRLKLDVPVTPGPGQYFQARTPDKAKSYRKITIEDIKSKINIVKNEKKTSPSSSCRKIRSAKEHNCLVRDRYLKRVEVSNIENLCKRDKFKLHIKLKQDDNKKQYSNELFMLLIPFALVLTTAGKIMSNTKQKSVKIT